MATTSKTTTNHEEIRKWVEEKGGYPAVVKNTAEKGEGGVIRIDYPGFSGKDTLEKITWEEFFKIFEENKLAFLYQEETKAGDESRFSKLVNRDSASSSASTGR